MKQNEPSSEWTGQVFCDKRVGEKVKPGGLGLQDHVVYENRGGWVRSKCSLRLQDCQKWDYIWKVDQWIKILTGCFWRIFV